MKKIHRNLVTIDIGTYNIPPSRLKGFISARLFGDNSDFLDFDDIKVESKEISLKDAIKRYGEHYTLYNKEEDGLVMLSEMEEEYANL